jgi:hypothetical protein
MGSSPHPPLWTTGLYGVVFFPSWKEVTSQLYFPTAVCPQASPSPSLYLKVLVYRTHCSEDSCPKDKISQWTSAATSELSGP